jgi:hypothetical protein
LPGETILTVEVWDEDMFSDDFIGSGSINLTKSKFISKFSISRWNSRYLGRLKIKGQR